MGAMSLFDRRRLLTALVVLGLVASACGGGGNGGGTGDTTPASTTATGPREQEAFHENLMVGVRARFDDVVAERFTLQESSIRVADTTIPGTEFTSQKERGEFARDNGLLGYGVADLCASNCFEYWGIITYVFRNDDGSRAVFERFPNGDQITISDATKVNSESSPYATGKLGNTAVDTYAYDDGSFTYFLTASLVDGNALHYVSAVVDVAVGQDFDAMGELRRVLAGLDGFYPALFEEFLKLGGTDAPTTTTTRDPDFVPADQGEIPGDG
ncbi:MAG: hypothetical protein HYU28_03855 [Actinobacteria bacterium]|nr:hypothetical protein [Actinomycetota bacterium]